MRRRAWIVAGAAVGIALGSALLWPREAARQVRTAGVPIELDLGREFPAHVLNPVYNAGDCEGIKSYFDAHPIPLHARDSANGNLIVGWQVVCEGKAVVSGGQGAASADSSRSVVRTFGEIVLYYLWDPALAQWK